ncbi:TetR/AcrR family transcriptional regulator [Paramicrobacterium chengjingii]|uniref:TetR/AcrR family transcriptional regulator n=1 Tax=Paramicrobacterium chengjingii TaxID=2769067 RepID=A0ABX6YHS0_9MICO|nr:TetR/AcrR family transcriptional regulator [Microbacterium chengjingii]QPZ38364.1 TetR/AcrR family transcriptional regulator [Microbacterium chengjingii]
MPTGMALLDPREQLFAAAGRVLVRDGPSALTSRAVVAEAGVAKGVLHRHFATFDEFLADYVNAHVERVEAHVNEATDAVGTRTVRGILVDLLVGIFDAETLGAVAIVTSRDAVRARLRDGLPFGIPLLAQATSGIDDYLVREQAADRIAQSADVNALALSLVGTGHLLFAGKLGATPDRGAVDEIVESIIVGALRAT